MSSYGSSSSRWDDPAKGLARLATSMRSFQRVVRSATRAEGHYQGSDARGVVTMAADSAGRVESVDINREWFARQPAASLGPALFEAYQAVLTEVLNASVERMEAAEEAEAHRHEPVADQPGRSTDIGVRSTAPLPTFADVQAALRDLEERQYERESRRKRRLAEASTEQVVHGPSRMVSVTVRGGEPAEITVANGVRRDRVADLAQDVVLALRAVRERATGHNPSTGR
ncbi:hypothetical protein ACQPYA_00370 [Micromonospora sp. CA-263727]|uniref:hypothetical protein n=1 Tax=Micromonospora sp. CA-263727 TaxID=3239967 RepID=UPI003D93376B